MAKETKFHELKGVEVFDVGEWNGKKWTDEDLDEMVENFNELKATYDFPGKISHDESQGLVKAEGLPAIAYMEDLYRKGTKLVADFGRVPDVAYELLKNGAYRKVSAEIYEKVQLNGKWYKNVLSAVAWLGGQIPAVGSLSDALALYQRAGARALTFEGDARRTIVTFDTVLEELDDEAAKLEADLADLAERAKNATKGTRGAPAFRTFLGETLAKLRGLRKSKNAIGEDTSAEVRRTAIEKALRDQFGGYPYVVETFEDYAIVDRDGRYWQIPYAINDAGEVVLSAGDEVERTWRPKNAGPSGEEEADMATTKAVLAALGLPDTATDEQIVAAVNGLKAAKADHSATDVRVTQLETDLKTLREENGTLKSEFATRDANDAVKAAIEGHKILPAQEEWAKTYALKDLAGFKAFVEKAPEVFEAGERGSAGAAPDPKSEISQFQAKVAEKVKAGKNVDEAQREVAAEEPELFAAIRARR